LIIGLIKAVRNRICRWWMPSLVAPVLHQNHDYGHVAGGKEKVWRGRKPERKFSVYGGCGTRFTFLM